MLQVARSCLSNAKRLPFLVTWAALLYFIVVELIANWR